MVPGSNYPGLEGLKEFNLKIDSTVYEGSEMVCDISYEEIERMNAQKYNASVEDEQSIAEEWGEAVRAFKSK